MSSFLRSLPVAMALKLPFVLVIFIAVLFSVTRCSQNQAVGKTISAQKVYDIINDSIKVNQYVILDTRARMDYVRGHLVSAIWLSPDSIVSKISILAREQRPFIIYDSASTQNSMAARMLAQHGITNFYEMSGGFAAWSEKGYPAAIQLVRNTSDKVDLAKKDISAAEAFKLLSNGNSAFVLIDIRSYPAYAEAHIENAMSIPYVPINEFVVKIEAQNFPRNKPIILYSDAYSDLGEKASDVMLRNDFSNLYLLKGGIEGWVSEKYPMVWQ
jgi:rhodanese-related sulfurtransferase